MEGPAFPVDRKYPAKDTKILLLLPFYCTIFLPFLQAKTHSFSPFLNGTDKRKKKKVPRAKKPISVGSYKDEAKKRNTELKHFL